MSVMTFRTDATVDHAISYLQTHTGRSKSDVIRDALLNAEHEARRAAMRSESLALRDDPQDLAEARAVLADMGGTDAW